MITAEIAKSINECVLCWLATASDSGVPNVSPKEAFLFDKDDGTILIANIASPKSERNIRQNESVCVSFVNVFTQKGFKIVATARVWRSGDSGYQTRCAKLIEMIGTAFPILSVFELTPVSVHEIIAPSYKLFPQTGTIDRVKESLRSYDVEHYVGLVEADR